MFKIATKTMANERTTHQQRKPPDVEEALSSMLWTPYECNGTETSSDDDVADDYNQLQHHNQSYDYDKYPHNYIAVVPITSLRATSNANNTTACYFAEDSVGQPSSLANNVATPLVPFPLTVANCSNETNLLPTATRLHYRESKNYHKVSTINALSDATYEQATNITASANVNRTKRSYYPRYAALNKWWPASSSYRGAPTTLPSFTATPTLTTTTTGVERQPPSYESLYAIKPHSKRHHLQLLKPVLNTWNRLANTNANKSNNNSNPDIFEYNIAQQEQEQDEEQQQLDNNNVLRSTNNQHFAEESFAANFVNEDCNVETNVASTNVDNQPIINLNNRQQQQQQIHAGLYGQHCEMPPTITTAHKQEKLKLMSHTQQQPAANNTRSPQQTQENLAKFVKGNPLITKATTIKDLNDQQQQQQQRVVEYGTDTEQVTQLQMNVFSLEEKETNSPQIKSKRDHSRKRTNQQANEYKSLFYYRNEIFVESISTSCLLELDGNKADCTSERGTDTALNGKPNNKCLAELERLYAEFRASEQLREQQLKLNEMRLNVPARGGDDVMTAPKFNSNSCVILTDTNSVTALMKPSQLSPSLTIQVNQNNNNNNHNDNVIQNNNNNNSNASKFSESASTTVNYKSLQNQSHDDDVEKCKNSREAIINNAKTTTTTTTTTATSGICVVNCNYVNSKNSNNNINNNKNNNNNNYSLNDNVNNSDHNRVTTNLTIEKTQQQQQLHNTNVFMIDSYKKQNNNNLNQIQNLTNNDYNNAATVSNITVDAMPNLISDINIIINSENDHDEYKNNDNERDQVNVIQVNETTTTTPTKITTKRTFTSTECQTDDISSEQLRMPSPQVVEATSVIEATPTYMNNRDQRRHRRRERRFLHYTNSLINPVLSFNHAMLRHRPPPPTHPTHPHFQTHPHHTHLMERHSMPVNHVTALLHPAPVPPPPPPPPAALLRSMLPDILHNHFPPPYSALSLAIGNDSGHILESSGPTPTPTPTPITPPPPPSLLPRIQQPALVPSATASTLLSATPVLPASAITTVSNNNNLLTSVISTVPLPNATQLLHDGRFSFPLPVMRRSPSERSGKGCCGQWFAGPPLRALIAVVALGGLACALSGAALGATGLAGPPSSHLTAALLMIGVGVVLVTVSGAAWRMTAPGGPPCLGLGSSVDLGACSRRPCSRGGAAPPGLLYPEFQHRPPPPSYQASMQEYRLRLLLLDRDRQSGVVRGNSPPPTYRSHAGSLLRAPLTTTQRGGSGCGGGSSIAGSEYSFPPSYRSRNNTTPGTINSRRSIETEPSGRLLANEDLPEPLSVEQLSEYDSLQQRRLNSRLQSTTAVTTAALHKSNNMVNNKKDFNGNVEEKSSRKGMFKLTKDTINVEENPDRITIVTITAENQNGDDNDTLTTTTSSAGITNRSSNGSSSNTSNSGNNRNMQQQAERIEILAHL